MRIFKSLLFAAAIASLAACGGSNKEPAEPINQTDMSEEAPLGDEPEGYDEFGGDEAPDAEPMEEEAAEEGDDMGMDEGMDEGAIDDM